MYIRIVGEFKGLVQQLWHDIKFLQVFIVSCNKYFLQFPKMAGGGGGGCFFFGN